MSDNYYVIRLKQMLRLAKQTLDWQRWHSLLRDLLMCIIRRWYCSIAIFIPTMIADSCCKWDWRTFYSTLPVSSIYTFVIQLCLRQTNM